MYVYISKLYGEEKEVFPTYPDAIHYIMRQKDVVYHDVVAYDIKGKIKQISKETHQLIREWDSVFEAAEECKIKALDILKCLRGLTGHSGGFEWSF